MNIKNTWKLLNEHRGKICAAGGTFVSACLFHEDYKKSAYNLFFKSQWYKETFTKLFIVQKNLNLPTQYSKFIPHQHTLDTLSKNLDKGVGNNVSGGVRILWGPPGCGKSTYTISVCNSLVYEKKINGVVLVNGNRNNIDDTALWLNKCLGYDILSEGNMLSALFPHQPPKHTIFIFDQFDNLYRKCQNKDMLRVAIKSLAEDGEKHDSYIVVLCISDPNIAAEMLLLNGGQKIRLIDHSPVNMKWTKEEVVEFLDECTTKTVSKSELEGCIRVGTPQFCKDIGDYSNEDNLDEAISCYENLWKEGSDIVKGRHKSW